MTAPRLILFAGRPGVGKTTLARALANTLGAVFLRIDTIEAGLRRSHAQVPDLMDAGYTVAQALAADALGLGQTVVADAVHGHEQGWHDWSGVAAAHGVSPTWFHVVCSDPAEHEKRIKARAAGGAEQGADWTEITTRPLAPPPPDWPMIDTAGRSEAACLSQIMAHLGSR